MLIGKRKVTMFLIIVFALTMLVPAYGAELNENKQILTLEEIQNLAVKYSRGMKKVDINIENVDRNQRIVKKAKDRINANYGKLPLLASELEAQSNALASNPRYLELMGKKMNDEELTPEESEELFNLQAQITVAGKAASDTSSMVSSMSSTKKDLNKKEDQLENAEEDVEKAEKDLKEEMKQIASLLAFKYMELEDAVNLLEKSYNLNLRLTEIERIKKDLGMAVDTDIDTQAVTASDYGKKLKYYKDQLQIIKRNINDLIGREINAPLKIVKYNVPESIIPAPMYQAIVDDVLKNSYELYKLNREIEDLEEDLDDTDGSHEEIIAENQVKLAKLNKDEKVVALQNELKSKLAQYNQDAKSYQEAIISYRAAEKEYNWNKKKYELGLISALQYQGCELAYLKALNDKISAGYKYYLTKKEFELFRNSVDTSNYNLVKAKFSAPTAM